MDNEDNQNNNHHLHKDVFLYIDDLNDLNIFYSSLSQRSILVNSFKKKCQR